jgi:fungal STAND N-terminal Goodbye domain
LGIFAGLTYLRASRGLSPQPCAACAVPRTNPHHFCPCTFVPTSSTPFPLVASMSSTVQATSSTSSTSNIQLITNALVDYAKITGIDLSKNPFAAAIEQANSPGAILELLQEREKAFKDYREENRRLISCLSPAVNVIQAFSGILGEAVSLVSHTCHLVTLLT